MKKLLFALLTLFLISFSYLSCDNNVDVLNPDEFTDTDGDGIMDAFDNCLEIANADQADLDNDGLGDACDDDVDGDEIPNEEDNCPMVANPNQVDIDEDGLGDQCDPDPNNADTDEDGILDGADNCPTTANPNQEDLDGDGIGDVCDDDLDGDGIANADDNCIENFNPGQEDEDSDGEGDVCDNDIDNDGIVNDEDNCPEIANPNQEDTDEDGIGDVCDNDDDGDGIENEEDNCPDTPNEDQADIDEDGIGDVCDDDIDGDTILNDEDNCPTIANTDQADTDEDGIGDVCEETQDTDEDGIPDEEDNCPDTPNEDQADADGDGIGDVCDDDNTEENGFTHDGTFYPTDVLVELRCDDGYTQLIVLGDASVDIQNMEINGTAVDGFQLGFYFDGMTGAIPDGTYTWSDSMGNGTFYGESGIGINSNLETNDVETELFINSGTFIIESENGVYTIEYELQTDGGVVTGYHSSPVDFSTTNCGDMGGDTDGDSIPDEEDNCPNTPNINQSDIDGDGIGDVCDDDIDGDTITNDMDNCLLIPNMDQADTNNDGIGDVCENGFTHNGTFYPTTFLIEERIDDGVVGIVMTGDFDSFDEDFEDFEGASVDSFIIDYMFNTGLNVQNGTYVYQFDAEDDGTLEGDGVINYNSNTDETEITLEVTGGSSTVFYDNNSYTLLFNFETDQGPVTGYYSGQVDYVSE